mgnify:CR=1 FL=1
MLDELKAGDQVLIQEDKETAVVTVSARYSINPGGPLTYYTGHDVENRPHDFHISQVKVRYSFKKAPAPMTRESILDQAKQIVMQDRNLDYGSPEDNFRDIADLWNTYLSSGNWEERQLEPHDVAVMMILVKISRLKTSPSKEDHWVDIAGYSACGAQAVGK